MLEVINAGSAELSHTGSDSAMILNCWEKSSPLIKELERTVNFAERKCGDLMQQLHFYKEYYEKWIQAERLNNNNMYQKKKMKKLTKNGFDEGSSSENEFEKVNQYFYKKIRNKITEMNREISQANRKLQSKYENYNAIQKSELKTHEQSQSQTHAENHEEDLELKAVENIPCKSEPPIAAVEEVTQTLNSIARPSRETTKVSENQSGKSVPSRNKDVRKRELFPLKKRYSSLQRYKLRSKSLPQGVRRKFGFGGFIEVFDPKANLRNSSRSKSKTSLKVDSYRSFKTFKSEGRVKTKKLSEAKNGFLCKLRNNPPISARNLQYRVSNFKSERRLNEKSKNYFSKSIKSDSAVPKELDFSEIAQPRNSPLPSIDPQSTSDNFCQDIVPSTNAIKTSEVRSNSSVANLNHLISKPNTMIPFLRQPIPFIPCSSTSKTFNLGLNVQQVLSLIKRRRHSITLQTLVKNGMRATRSITDKMEPTVNTLFFSHTATSHSHVASALCPARACIEDSFSIVTDDIGCRSNCALLKRAQAMRSEEAEGKKLVDVDSSELKFMEAIEDNKVERPEDVWVVDQPDNASRGCKKSRSRCTCFPKHCVDYEKVLREYTGWRMPASKTASFTADAYHSYPPMIGDCSRPKLCSTPSREDVNWSLQESEGKIELMKVHNDLINLNRRYSSLEEQITQRNLDDYEANAELDAMESELSLREMKFKDIINFYQQLILLKEKLKSLRMKNNINQQAGIQQPQYQRPKRDPLRPTPSMTLAKVLRKIQGLQDKIKLIDAP